VYATPVYATPVYATQLQQNGHRHSSAAPVTAPTTPIRQAPAGAPVPRVTILDTGLARKTLRPKALDLVHHAQNGWAEGPDDDGDDYLDPAAGHGTFIAGLIDLLTPGCDLTAERVLSNYGAGDEVAIAQRIDAAAADLLSLSFGGYALAHMNVLAAAISGAQQKGTVVVASAGNDGICRPSLPAALPGVVSVAALGPNGPARFSNYGPWVRACAPGVDIVSRFFTKFDGAGTAPPGGIDPDKFASWARWSGSSFSAPIVVAALARELQHGLTPAEAVERVVDAPGLLRIPDFGTVVNVQ
jgi:subtilisin family serine protease